MTFDSTRSYNSLPALPQGNEVETEAVLRQLVITARHMGELKGLCSSITDPSLLINTLALKEGKDSAAIDNIATTYDELYDALTGNGKVDPSALDVLNGIEALYMGWEKMAKRKDVLSTTTLLEIAQLIGGPDNRLRDVRGNVLKNAITGDVVYTPPEGVPIIREKLMDLERFINDHNYSALDPLVKIALINYQLEAIQPFSSGNGRVARIVNSLYLVQQGMLPQPVLYLSEYIDRNKPLYYHLQASVSAEGNWEGWILYHLRGVAEAAQRTAIRIKQITNLKRKTEAELKAALGPSYSPELLNILFELPYMKIEVLQKRGLAHRQTAAVWLKKMVAAGILEEKKKSKTLYFINSRLMHIFAAP